MGIVHNSGKARLMLSLRLVMLHVEASQVVSILKYTSDESSYVDQYDEIFYGTVLQFFNCGRARQYFFNEVVHIWLNVDHLVFEIM